ncbi:hypothetical protein GQ54DRAFT_316065 [Martensiomyces pterosporus]|nr:hypothetical protein GQ54DRAFT_316065 [Martensiomyces pterosporus]
MSANAAEKKTLTLWQKALTRDEDWHKDELRAVVFWLISAYSVFLGLFYGLLGFRGLPCFITYFVGSIALPSIYWTSYLGVDDEDFGGKMEVLGDSIGSGVAMFLLSWVGVYTMIHA